MRTFVIIPAYNEEQTIGAVIRNVQNFCTRIVVVDDGSTDDTYNNAKNNGIKVLRHIINRGQGAALQTGVEYALREGAEIIVHFDADGQHRAQDINLLVKPIIKGEAEVVLGSRFLISNSKFLISNQCQITKCQIPKMPLNKFITLKLALLHQWFFTGLRISDSQCGLRAFSRRAAQKIKINQDRMAHSSEIIDQIAHHRLSYQEVPVCVKYTDYSLKKGQKSFLGSLRVVYDFFMGRVINKKLRN